MKAVTWVLPTRKKAVLAAIIVALFFTGHWLEHARDGAEPPHQAPPLMPLYLLTLPALWFAEVALGPLRTLNQRHGWPDEICAIVLVAFLYLSACAAVELGGRLPWPKR